MDKWTQMQSIMNEDIHGGPAKIKEMFTTVIGVPPESSVISKKLQDRIMNLEKFVDVDVLKQHSMDMNVLNNLIDLTGHKLPIYGEDKMLELPMHIPEEMRSDKGLSAIGAFVSNPSRHGDYNRFLTTAFYEPIIHDPHALAKVITINNDKLNELSNEILSEQLMVKEQFVENLKAYKYKEDEVKVLEYNRKKERYELSTLNSIYAKINKGLSTAQKSRPKGPTLPPFGRTAFIGGRGGGSGPYPPIIKIKKYITTDTQSPQFSLLASFYKHNN